MKSVILSFVVSILISTSAFAEVQSSGANGFIVQHNKTIALSKELVFAAMTAKVGQWWDADHSFSGNAENMVINSECFCERWEDNLVHHLNTTIWMGNSKIIMQGGLGPLKEIGLNGTMIWTVSDNGDGATKLIWKYYVTGYSETDLITLAPIVDDVLKQQIDRLVSYLK